MVNLLCCQFDFDNFSELASTIHYRAKFTVDDFTIS